MPVKSKVKISQNFGAFSEYMNLFMFSKKATIIDEIFTVDLTLCSKCQIDGEDFVDFYHKKITWTNKKSGRGVVFIKISICAKELIQNVNIIKEHWGNENCHKEHDWRHKTECKNNTTCLFRILGLFRLLFNDIGNLAFILALTRVRNSEDCHFHRNVNLDSGRM